MPEQPRGGYSLTVRFSREIGEGLEIIRRRSGVGPTDYIRMAVYRALQEDVGFILLPDDDPAPHAAGTGSDADAATEGSEP